MRLERVLIYYHSSASHRPININNAFNAKQVKVVCKQKEAGEIPRYQEVFEVDSDDDKDIFDEEDEGLEEDCKDSNEYEQRSEVVDDDDAEDDEINERGKRKVYLTSSFACRLKCYLLTGEEYRGESL